MCVCRACRDACGAPCAFLIRIHTRFVHGPGASQGLALGVVLDLVAGEGTLTLFRANGLLSAGDGDGDGDEESEDEVDELPRLGEDAGPLTQGHSLTSLLVDLSSRRTI